MLERIGKYEIRLQIGRGAMGVVYEGFDPSIGRRVAVKTLRTEMFEPRQMPDVLARFKREAQSAGRLSHPHIVTIHEYGEHEGTAYIVMEYISGNELGNELNRGVRFSLEDVVRLMTQLLGALGHAHEHGVVHRDLKPANIFLLEDGSLKVVDFGIAWVEASDLTDTGAMLGTPAYMSPEQCLGTQVDHRSDLFSAGVILYQLLTGDKPFTGSITTIIQKVLRQDPLPPSELNPTLSPAWDRVVARAMAKKPEARYESAQQFAEEVKMAFAAERGRGAQTDVNVSVDVTVKEPPVQEKARAAQQTPSQDDSQRRRKRKKWVVIGIIVGIVILVRGFAELVIRMEAQKKEARRQENGSAQKVTEERARREAEEKAGAEGSRKADEAQPAARTPGTAFKDCPDCPSMVVIPAGSFLMGSPASDKWRAKDEGPQRRVSISRPFAAGKYEVTFDEWDACVRESGCSHNPEDSAWGRGRRPVIDVSWRDARQFAEWLSRKTGKRYRLLTEAEWEYVARAGTTTAFSTGATIATSQANYGGGRERTAPVGSYGPNAFGLYDVHGNVWEWTEDCWNASYAGAPADGSAWLDGDCSQRGNRGGSWDNDPYFVRSASRYRSATDFRYSNLGFRLARTLE